LDEVCVLDTGSADGTLDDDARFPRARPREDDCRPVAMRDSRLLVFV